ncbi:MAG: DUF885 domain-containing protein [Candidatus Zixiibacteriota bacterium]
MIRWTTALLILLSLTLLAAPDLSAARNEESFDKLTGEILAALQLFYPVHATEMGIHDYDHRLADYSPGSVRQMRGRLTGFVEKLHQYRNYSFSPEDAIDFKLIRSNVEMTLLDIKEIKWHEKSPQLYIDEAVNGVYFLLLSQHAPLSEKLLSILARMKAVPELFQAARSNLKGPPDVYLDLADESLESANAFYQEVAAELMRQFPERADEILRVSTQAREAMNDFAAFLDGLTPGPATSFAIGKVNFDYMLSHGSFLNYDSDSLLRMGEALLAAAQEEYRLYRQYVDENHQTGRDSVFVPASFRRKDVLDYYRWEIDRVRRFLGDNSVVSVPEDIAPVEVVETPQFLRSMVAGIAYHPAGPFERNQRAIFYVRPLPDTLDPSQRAAFYRYVHRRGFKGSVVHEAYPGHHLQMQLAGRNASLIRRWQSNMLMVEGWALYCEELMYHAGLYGEEDPAMWLAILGGIRYRAARIIADVKLHTGQFTYEQCADWMISTLDAESESDKEYHRKMVRKYTLTPSVWMSYLVGKIEIERLRDEVMQRDGDAFDEQAFYDKLLSFGSIPPALIRASFGL